MTRADFEGLTEAQRCAVMHKDGPLLVLAGPGSGKTRVITYRIASLINSGVRPYNICAITFTNKAASEMRERAVTLGASGGAHISTFHSLCVRILRRYGKHGKIASNFSIYDTADQLRCMKQAVKDCGLDKANFAPGKMLAAVSALKNNMEGAEEYKGKAGDYFEEKLAKVYTVYQQILSDNNAVDFDDLLMKTAFLLRDSAEVRVELSNFYRYLLVDEYQDTNQAQYRIAKYIASEHGNICVTGDPDQSIYRWRGADIRNIMAFETDWPTAKVVKLEENFRSTAKILEAADSLIAVNRNRKAKRLIAIKPDGKDITIDRYEDERFEAAGVAEKIGRLIVEGVSAKQIGIFYRVNSMSRVLEESFIKGRIPYQIVRGVEFYGRKEVRDVMAYLKVMSNPADDVALSRIINTPRRGIGDTTIERIGEYAKGRGMSLWEGMKAAGQIGAISRGAAGKVAEFVNLMEKLGASDVGSVAGLMEKVVAESGLDEMYKKEGTSEGGELENIAELINGAANYDDQAEDGSLLDYLQQISLFSDTDVYDKSVEKVALMTLHAAKGLEFDHVFIVGVEDGLLPHERSRDDEDELEEERRLLFVGITRARAGLAVSFARYRTIYGSLMRTIPSQFLYELGVGFGSERVEESEGESYGYEMAEMPVEKKAAFRVGDMVRHGKFGIGQVSEYVDMGGDSIVLVKFNTGQRKSLMLKYAKLEKI